MDNQFQQPIGGLRLPVPLVGQYQAMRYKKLIELIDKPQWVGIAPDSERFVKQAEDRAIFYGIIQTLSNTDYRYEEDAD